MIELRVKQDLSNTECNAVLQSATDLYKFIVLKMQHIVLSLTVYLRQNSINFLVFKSEIKT